MVLKFADFVEFYNGFQPAKFQFCRLSVSSFTEGLQKHSDDVIMTSFHNYGIRNFYILWNYLEAVNLPSLKSNSYLNQILQRFL